MPEQPNLPTPARLKTAHCAERWHEPRRKKGTALAGGREPHLIDPVAVRRLLPIMPTDAGSEAAGGPVWVVGGYITSANDGYVVNEPSLRATSR